MELNKHSRLARAERRVPSRIAKSVGAPSAPIDGAARSDAARARIQWYWNRLRRMSVPEVGYRFARSALAALQRRGFAVVRETPAANFACQVRPFVALDPKVTPDPYLRAASDLLAGEMPVFDRVYRFGDLPQWNRDPKTGKQAPLAFGKALDYRDEALVGDIKYLWEINRHLDLVVLAQAYQLTGDKMYLHGLRRLLESWFDQCPYLLGPNWSSSLELGIRLINWSICWQLAGGVDSPMFQGKTGLAFRDRWLTSIYRHMHFLLGHFSRYSSANNHLIGEAAGLYIGSIVWPYWPTTVKWRAKARRELIRECLRQNAPDGVNREQAIAYQQFVLDFLLLAGLAGRSNGDDFPVDYWQRIERMLEFIAAVMDVRANVPMIGDADDGYVVRLSRAPAFSVYRSLLATGAVVFHRGDLKTKAGAFDDKSRWLLGAKGAALFEDQRSGGSATPRVAFPEGGYFVLGRDLDTPNEIRIVADAGPLGYQSIAAHGHADALAFTLSMAGEEFLIDPGTYAYHTERWWRDYFRGTAAHNTLRLDGENQSVIGGGFMWTRHAHVRPVLWESDARRDRLLAQHDGYERLSDPCRHERELAFDKAARALHVTDVVHATAAHRVEVYWHFAEDVTVVVDSEGAVLAEKRGHRLRVMPRYPIPIKASVYRGEVSLPAGWISRRFGVKEPTTTVVWRVDITGTTRLPCALECVLAAKEGAP